MNQFADQEGLMNKARKAIVNVKGTKITVLVHREQDYISLTDIARHKDAERTDYLISNWMRNRNTVEFLGMWEVLNNPKFNPIEFDGFRKSAGLNSFVLTVKQWAVSDPYFSRGLKIPLPDLLEAMDVAEDVAVKIIQKQRFHPAAKEELELLKEIGLSEVETRTKCQLVMDLMSGVDPEKIAEAVAKKPPEKEGLGSPS